MGEQQTAGEPHEGPTRRVDARHQAQRLVGGLDAAHQEEPLPLEKVHVIYPEHGNVGPASVPMTLVSAAASGRVSHGARVGLMGIGSGLNCAMAEVIW